MSQSKTLDPLDWYRWWWKRFRLDRNIQRLHYVARGFFRELLDEQWDKGFIPDVAGELAEVCGCPLSVMEEHWPSLQRYFPANETGHRMNADLEACRTELDEIRVKKSRAGLASAEKRANGIAAKKSTPVADELTPVDLNQHISTPVQHLLGNGQQEEKRREEKRKVSKATPSHPSQAGDTKHPDLLIYEIYPRLVGRAKALVAIQKAVVKVVKGESDGRCPAGDATQARRFLYATVLAYSRSAEGTNPDRSKIPHPATWFNNARYLDDQAEWQHVSGDTHSHRPEPLPSRYVDTETLYTTGDYQ